MAWFKFDHETPDKQQVLEIAASLDIPRAHIIGALCLVWRWFSDQTVTGQSRDCHGILDVVSETLGIEEALERVGWLVRRDGTMSIPNFDRWLGSAHDARRQRSKRNRDTGKAMSRDSHVTCHADVTLQSRPQTQTQNQNQNQKKPPSVGSRESKPSGRKGGDDSLNGTKPVHWALPDHLAVEPLIGAWAAWIEYRAAAGKPVAKHSAESAFIVFEEHGAEACAQAVRKAIASGYAGFTDSIGLQKPQNARRDDFGPNSPIDPSGLPECSYCGHRASAGKGGKCASCKRDWIPDATPLPGSHSP